MNEGDEFPVIIAKILAALLPVAVYLAVEHPYETRRFLEDLSYRPRLLLWRWRRWQRWTPEQRQRYVELHGEPG